MKENMRYLIDLWDDCKRKCEESLMIDKTCEKKSTSDDSAKPTSVENKIIEIESKKTTCDDSTQTTNVDDKIIKIESKETLQEDSDECIIVQHIKGSSIEHPKNEDSWKKYWENKLNKDFPSGREYCDCCGNIQDDFVGAHVSPINDNTKSYIYPVCRSCNSTYGENTDDNKSFEAKKDYLAEIVKDEIDAVYPE